MDISVDFNCKPNNHRFLDYSIYLNGTNTGITVHDTEFPSELCKYRELEYTLRDYCKENNIKFEKRFVTIAYDEALKLYYDEAKQALKDFLGELEEEFDFKLQEANKGIYYKSGIPRNHQLIDDIGHFCQDHKRAETVNFRNEYWNWAWYVELEFEIKITFEDSGEGFDLYVKQEFEDQVNFEEFTDYYNYHKNIFDNPGLFPDHNDIDPENDTAESLADELMISHIYDHGDIPDSAGFRDRLIKLLEDDWDRFDIISLEEFLKDKDQCLYHKDDMETPLGDEFVVDKYSGAVYHGQPYDTHNNLLHFGDIGDEIVYGPIRIWEKLKTELDPIVEEIEKKIGFVSANKIAKEGNNLSPIHHLNSPVTLKDIKLEAYNLRKATKIPHHQALKKIAQKYGYDHYLHAKKTLDGLVPELLVIGDILLKANDKDLWNLAKNDENEYKRLKAMKDELKSL